MRRGGWIARTFALVYSHGFLRHMGWSRCSCSIRFRKAADCSLSFVACFLQSNGDLAEVLRFLAQPFRGFIWEATMMRQKELPDAVCARFLYCLGSRSFTLWAPNQPSKSTVYEGKSLYPSAVGVDSDEKIFREELLNGKASGWRPEQICRGQ